MKKNSISKNMQIVLLDYVTKGEFNQAMSKIDGRFEQVDKRFDDMEKTFKKDMASMYEAFEMRLDRVIKENKEDFKRYVGALSEEFHHRTSILAEVLHGNTKDIRMIKDHLALE